MTSAWAKRKSYIALATVLPVLAGCFEFGDPVETSNTTLPPAANNPPSISGQPTGAVRIGNMYSFTPTATDPDGDPLTFSIQNGPRWAVFNTSTGTLSGQPGLGDVGIYADIAISVSDSVAVASLPRFSVNVTQSELGSVTLTWNPPTQNDDGSMLSDLAAYKIYYGLSEGNYTNQIYIPNPGISAYVVEDLVPDTYYFVATAVKQSGVESQFSNVSVRPVISN